MARLLVAFLLFNLSTFLITSHCHNPPPPVHPKPPASKAPCPPPPPTMYPLTCPIDALRLGVCVDVLWGMVLFGIGGAAKDACCPVLGGLVGLDAALCLCESIKLKLFNISILFPFGLDVLVNECGKQPPPGFQCLA